MREIAPFGVRMPAELKVRLETAAKSNGRSMNTEVVARLAASFDDKPATIEKTPLLRAYLSNDLTETERQLLEVFRRLPPNKQLALLSLFD